MKKYLIILFAALVIVGCEEEYPPIVAMKPVEKGAIDTVYMNRAEVLFESLFEHYWSDKAELFCGKYPNKIGTPEEPTHGEYDEHAFLWGFGGALSAFNTIVQNTKDVDFRAKYEDKLKTGLLKYYTTGKNPPCFASFVNGHDDRYYDDAIWIGIDLIELYEKTKDSWYLDYAKIVWTFVMSGKDDLLGGGIYWQENPKDSKNTCVNAPAAVLALKMYKATYDETYLETGKELYQWTKETLQDKTDYRYWDNIKLDGTIENWKFSYNSGQMLQAGVLLYNATKDEEYLVDAKNVAEACYNAYFNDFTTPTGESFRILSDGHLWFNTVMIRGFVELNKVESQGVYTTAIRKTLEHGWKYAIDEDTKLLKCYLSGNEFGSEEEEEGDILHQGAIAELFARMAVR